jgi:ABC-2 type transport system ATP-binding protein
VLNNVSIDIYDGEFVGLIGPNGAGKSTLINSITSQIDFNKGEIFLNNLDISVNPSEAKKYYGYSPETSCFPDVLNAYDVLELIASLKEVHNKEKEIDEVLSITGLLSDAPRPIYAYSTGMKQKLSICVALIGNSRLIILDETLNGVDPISSFSIKQHLKKLTRAGASILMSSHILETIDKYCDRIVIINNGEICRILTQDELKKIKIDEGKDLEEIFIELIQTDSNFSRKLSL